MADACCEHCWRQDASTRATQIAASIGQSMALVFGFLGFFYNPFLMFIALFVWIGAAQEASMAQMKSSLAGIPVMRAMITDFQTLTSLEYRGRGGYHLDDKRRDVALL